MMAMTLSSLSVLVSCNNKEKDDDTYTYSTSTQTTLVTGFALQADAEVLANLDSVHFTIDYDNGLIYNADSLPVGTDISALKVTVNFLNTIHSAVFNITGATYQSDTTINYTTSMTKSLDFTGKTVNLIDKPEWAKGARVVDGNIVLSVKPKGFMVIVK